MDSMLTSLKLAFGTNVSSQNTILCYLQEDSSNGDKVQTEIISPTRIYSCPHCYKNYATSFRLRKHIEKYPDDFSHQLKRSARRFGVSL